MTAKVSKKPAGLDSSFKDLSINPTQSSKSTALPDSWEQEVTSATSSKSASPTASSPSTPLEDVTPGPPPPTPLSPSHRRGKSTDWGSFPQSAPPRSAPREMSNSGNADKRPEKSSTTANRMIAGALGVKGPKMTEEQRKYERAVREKERKRIENEREEVRRKEREANEAKKAVWDD